MLERQQLVSNICQNAGTMLIDRSNCDTIAVSAGCFWSVSFHFLTSVHTALGSSSSSSSLSYDQINVMQVQSATGTRYRVKSTLASCNRPARISLLLRRSDALTAEVILR